MKAIPDKPCTAHTALLHAITALNGFADFLEKSPLYRLLNALGVDIPRYANQYERYRWRLHHATCKTRDSLSLKALKNSSTIKRRLINTIEPAIFNRLLRLYLSRLTSSELKMMSWLRQLYLDSYVFASPQRLWRLQPALQTDDQFDRALSVQNLAYIQQALSDRGRDRPKAAATACLAIGAIVFFSSPLLIISPLAWPMPLLWPGTAIGAAFILCLIGARLLHCHCRDQNLRVAGLSLTQVRHDTSSSDQYSTRLLSPITDRLTTSESCRSFSITDESSPDITTRALRPY